MDADTPEILDLERRRRMAAIRRQRESERLALLAKFVETKRRADDLRSWLGAYAQPAGASSHPDLQRMREWAGAQLEELDTFLDPNRLAAMIQDRDLFPEVDPLEDPLGEPPRNRAWGGSTALKNINAV